ncbi:MAG: efflux RND transporter periplasmic adaptor subunit [Bacteroidetes bacterium]|nr:efflux RND transporter periplasmic adaptor subunit [Bacteroidota bacterium]
MRSIIFVIAFIIVLVVLRLTLFSETEAGKAGGKPGAVAVPVKAIVAQESTFSPSIRAAGNLLAAEEVNLMPEASGKVIYLNLSEGKRVTKGELLLKLNASDLEAQLHKAESSVQLYESNLSRQDALLGLQGVSKQERDATEQQLLAAKADVEYYRAMIAKCEIRAPFTGILGLRNISEGAFVNTSTVVGSIFKTDELKLDFSVPERYAGSLKTPFQVTFTVQGDSRAFNAKVFALEPSADVENRAVKMRAKVENTGGDLIPGRFADVEVPLTRDENVIMLPTECIVPVLKGQQVWLSRKSKAEAVKVETGYRSDIAIEIRSGIEAGDTVITSGIMSLRPGSDLKIKIENQKAVQQ